MANPARMSTKGALRHCLALNTMRAITAMTAKFAKTSHIAQISSGTWGKNAKPIRGNNHNSTKINNGSPRGLATPVQFCPAVSKKP